MIVVGTFIFYNRGVPFIFATLLQVLEMQDHDGVCVSGVARRGAQPEGAGLSSAASTDWSAGVPGDSGVSVREDDSQLGQPSQRTRRRLAARSVDSYL